MNTILPQRGYRGPRRYRDMGKLMMLFMLQMNQGHSVSAVIEGVCVTQQCDFVRLCRLAHYGKGTRPFEWSCETSEGTKISAENFQPISDTFIMKLLLFFCFKKMCKITFHQQLRATQRTQILSGTLNTSCFFSPSTFKYSIQGWMTRDGITKGYDIVEGVGPAYTFSPPVKSSTLCRVRTRNWSGLKWDFIMNRG